MSGFRAFASRKRVLMHHACTALACGKRRLMAICACICAFGLLSWRTPFPSCEAARECSTTPCRFLSSLQLHQPRPPACILPVADAAMLGYSKATHLACHVTPKRRQRARAAETQSKHVVAFNKQSTHVLPNCEQMAVPVAVEFVVHEDPLWPHAVNLLV